MKPHRSTLVLPLVAALIVLILFTACGDNGSDNPGIASGDSADAHLTETAQWATHAMSGEVKGTSASIYTHVWVDNTESNPICSDDQYTDFQIQIAADGNLPANTHLTNPLPPLEQFFRLDIMAPLYYLDKGKCNYVAPSDVMTDVIIEGSYRNFDQVLTVLTCGNTGTLGEDSHITNLTQVGKLNSSGNTVMSAGSLLFEGTITCKLSDQMVYKFSFTGLQLK